MKKRDGLFIIAVFAVVSLSALYIAKSNTQLKVVYPPANPVLYDNDFSVQVPGGSLSVGKTSLDEAKKLFPHGKDLGMSTVYKTDSPECIMTFNFEQTVLKKLHLISPGIATSRNIKVGDPFSKVVAAYGKNYIYTGKAINASDFEATYQCDPDHGIIFQVRNNRVKAIILHEDTVSKTKLNRD